MLRDGLPADDGLRPSFLGHILVELLLDNCLAQDEPHHLDEYYKSLDGVDPHLVADFVCVATGDPPESLAPLAELIPKFVEVRFLYDYADNAKLLYRLNQVMARVGLAKIPDTMIDLLPQLRAAVSEKKDELLTPTGA